MKFDNSVRIPVRHKDSVTLFVWGDEQRGSEGFHKEAFEEMRNEFKRTPNAYGLHLADGWDWLRPSMRDKLQSRLTGDISARNQLDTLVLKAQDRDLKEYSFCEGRMIGVHTGHHTWEFLHGSSSDMRFASALRAPFMGFIGATRVVIGKESNTTRSFTILSTHGQGSGRAAGSDARYIDELAKGFIADVYARGHSAKGLAMPGKKQFIIRRSGPTGVLRMNPWYLNVGGFCEGYTDGWHHSYVEKSNYVPQPITYGKIVARIVKRKGPSDERALSGPTQTERKGKARPTETLDIQCDVRVFNDRDEWR